MCSHEPQCPSTGHTARSAAHVIAAHPEQGWSLLCNGIVLFDDGGLLLLNGRAEAPHTRPLPPDITDTTEKRVRRGTATGKAKPLTGNRDVD